MPRRNQEGLLMREQMAYFDKLRTMNVPPEEGLALLGRAPDVAPAAHDALPKPRVAGKRGAAIPRSPSR